MIHKSAPFATIVETVNRIRAGLPVMSRETRADLVSTHREAMASQHEVRQRFQQITRREAEVLGLLMAGKQVSDIARTRVVSESTVRTQVKSILAKLQVSSQLSASLPLKVTRLARASAAEPPYAQKRDADTATRVSVKWKIVSIAGAMPLPENDPLVISTAVCVMSSTTGCAAAGGSFTTNRSRLTSPMS